MYIYIYIYKGPFFWSFTGSHMLSSSPAKSLSSLILSCEFLELSCQLFGGLAVVFLLWLIF